MSDITLIELPFDILSKIFKYLTLAELRHVMLTCKTLKHVIEEDYTIWKAFTSFFVRNSVDNRETVLSAYHLCRISRNWIKGIYKPKIRSHYGKYMPWLKFHNSDAVLLSLGSKLSCYQTNQHGVRDGPYAWNIEVPIVERNDIRTNDISRFILKNNFIVCGNRDGCAIVYEYKGKKQPPRLLHHILDCHNEGRSEVSAVEMIQREDVSVVVTVSSNSPSLCYWNLRRNENDKNLFVSQKYDAFSTITVPSVEGFRCLALNQSQTKLAIGPNGNSKPLLLDVTTSKELSCKDLTPKPEQAVRDAQWHDENLVAYVTHAGNLQFIDTRTYNVVYDAKDPFLVTLYCVKTDGDRAILVGSAAHSRCVLYDRRNARSHVQMYFLSKLSSPIYSLDFDSTRLLAAADLSLACLNFNAKIERRRRRDYSSFNFQVV
ncbi:F-box/WD repeat-containing protein 4 [Choristoneura fumiferana]|uniref:F-box/WD repeat-containing protein 4 n=1 Tax=Choristoneura fumiferana TaxID=7141 RepID=UPI003D15BCC4